MVLNKKIIRTIKENKGQYLGAFLIILISSLMFVLMNLVSVNLKNTFENLSGEYVLCDAEFSTEGSVDIAALEKQFNAIVEPCAKQDYDIKKGQTLRIFSESTRVNIPAVVNGHSLKKGEILIDQTFAKANQLAEGDTIEINGHPYQIAGNMILPNYIYIIKSKGDMMNNPKEFGIAVLSQEDYKKEFSNGDFYAIRFLDQSNIRLQEAQVKNYFSEQGINVAAWESTTNNAKVTYVTMEVQMTKTMSTALPTLLMILACVLTGILMRRLIARESVIIGSLYAQGYRKKELRKHYLGYPLTIAGAGGILGSILGALLFQPMYQFMLTAFPMPPMKAVFNPLLLVISIGAPVLVLCGSTVLIVNQLLNRQAIDLMKGEKGQKKSNWLERSLKLDHFSFQTKFKIREQVRSLSRTAFLLFGVIVATMLLQYGLTMKSSLDYLLNEGFKELYQLKYEYVYNEEHNGIPPEGTEPFGAMYVTSQGEDGDSFIITGVKPDTKRVILKDLSGKPLTMDKAIMTIPLANKLGVKAGDTITVISDEDLSEVTLTIDAISSSYAGEFVFMPLERLNQMMGLAADSYIGIWTDEAMTFGEGEIRSTKSMDAVVEGFNSLIDQTAVMVYGLTVAAFILGVLIIYIVTTMVIEENRGNISLMKVFGYRKKEINNLILNSNTLIVVLGYILGIPALLVSVQALFQTLTESLQLIIPVKFSIGYLILGFLVVMLTYEMAIQMSKKKIRSVSMSEALKAGTE